SRPVGRPRRRRCAARRRGARRAPGDAAGGRRGAARLHDQRLETARGYIDHRRVRGPLLGEGLPEGMRPTVTSADAEVRTSALDAGKTVPVTVLLENPPGPDAVGTGRALRASARAGDPAAHPHGARRST